MALLPFDDRDGFIFLDGKIVPWREAQTHVLTHGLHYASSVFEGERAYNGKIFLSEEHSKRLIKSAEMIYMTLPVDVQAIEDAKKEVLEANGFKDAYVRAFAWYGGEMMGIDTSACVTHYAVACWDDWQSYFDPAERMKGISLATVPTRRPPPNTMRIQSKSAGNYQISSCAKHEARAQGAYDALILDWEGYIGESSGANIFFVVDGKLITPKPDRFLNGLTRQTVIKLAKQDGMEVDEDRRITPEELFQADEIFLTGSAAEISGVRSIKHGDDMHEFTVGPVTQKFSAAYTDLVNNN